MRHATVYAIETAQGIKTMPGVQEPGWQFGAGNVIACSWEHVIEDEMPSALSRFEMMELLVGKPVDLPTCPACAALLDLALEMRGKAAE